jgi:1,4-alpha-glucan branching enzyme
MATISPSSHDQLSARFGATPAIDGIHFSVWAPEARELQIVLEDGCAHRLLPKRNGYFQGILPARAGDRYKVLVDGRVHFPIPLLDINRKGLMVGARSWTRMLSGGAIGTSYLESCN